MCSVLKSEQFFVFFSDIFNIGEAADGRYCFTGIEGGIKRTKKQKTKYDKIQKNEFLIDLDQ